MTFFPEPLRPSEGRKEDHPTVDPIESDKKLKESGANWQLPGGEKISVYGAFLFFISEVISHCIRYEGGRLDPAVQDNMTSNLRVLKELLRNLQSGDQSKVPKFCQKFSEAWNVVFQEMSIISRLKRRGHIDLEKLHMLITDIEHYPPNEARKLGFYLQKYAGKEWLPVPFREMLSQLHIDHCVNRESSVLSKWLELITHILQK